MLEIRRLIRTLLGVLLTVVIAQAQPKPAKPPSTKRADSQEPGSKPTKQDELQEDGGPSDRSDSESATGVSPEANSDDLGDAPPAVKTAEDKVRPSPLTPRADEFPKRMLDHLPPEYDELLSDIAALRSRVAALTTTLFKSKLRVIIQTNGTAKITSLAVTLDDGVIFSTASRFNAEDEKTVYEHAVAPGHHLVGVEVEREDARGGQYKTWQTSRFAIVVPDSQLLETRLVLEDDSDMAEEFPDEADGEYDLRVRLRARLVEP
jgi:hypothetical protein